MIDIETLQAKLNSVEQTHVINYWNQLENMEKESLSNEINDLDLDALMNAFKRSVEDYNLGGSVDADISPIADDCKGSVADSSAATLQHYEHVGLEAISKGQVAVILLAGGQGTRLGVNYPKGMFSVGLPSNKTLFQLQAERLGKIANIANETFPRNSSSASILPWYIMASKPTSKATKSFFEENNFFGLGPDCVTIFEQGTLPCFSLQGKMLMESKSKVCNAPDGNGGLYKALVKEGILEDMTSKGIKYVHIYCVDNVLVKVADPVFIGFCIEKNANCAAKVVKKIEPEEKVGVICQVKDKYQVVEYSEISEATRNCQQANGDLKYNAGNICNHFLSTDFLNKFCRDHERELKYHIAEKKIACIDENGVYQKPTFNNGIKLEKFIFDIFQFSNAVWATGNFAVWEVQREDEFSPLKNGVDSKLDNANTCRNDLMCLHSRWLAKAGAKFAKDCKKDLFDGNFEISPLISYSGEGLKSIVQNKTLNESSQKYFLDYPTIGFK